MEAPLICKLYHFDAVMRDFHILLSMFINPSFPVLGVPPYKLFLLVNWPTRKRGTTSTYEKNTTHYQGYDSGISGPCLCKVGALQPLQGCIQVVYDCQQQMCLGCTRPSWPSRLISRRPAKANAGGLRSLPSRGT